MPESPLIPVFRECASRQYVYSHTYVQTRCPDMKLCEYVSFMDIIKHNMLKGSVNPLHSLIFFFLLPSNNSLIQEGSTTNDYFVPIIIIITKI